MRLLLFLLVVAVLTCAVSAETNIRAAAVHVHTTSYTETGDNLHVWPYAQTVYNSRAAGKSYTSDVNGIAEYKSSGGVGKGYLEDSSEFAFDGAAIGYDTLSTVNLQPNETELECIGEQLAVAGVDGATTGATPDEKRSDSMVGFIGYTGGKYDIDKYADDGGVYSISAGYEGDGRFDGKTSYVSRSGLDKNSTELNEDIYTSERFQATSNNKTRIEATIEWSNALEDVDYVNLTNSTP